MLPFVLAFILQGPDGGSNVFLGCEAGMLLHAGAIDEPLHNKLLATFARLEQRLELSAAGASVAQDLRDGQALAELFARAAPLAGICQGSASRPEGDFAVCRCEDMGYRFAVCAEFPHAKTMEPSWDGEPCAIRASGKDPWISSAALYALCEKNALAERAVPSPGPAAGRPHL